MNQKKKDREYFERLFHGDRRTMATIHDHPDVERDIMNYTIPNMRDFMEQREREKEEQYQERDRGLTCSAGKKRISLKDINIWRLSTDVYLWYLKMKKWLGHTPHVIDVKRLTPRWGFTDEAINTAIDKVADKGGTVFLPPAPNPTYDVTSSILMKDDVSLVGPPHAPHARIVKLLKGANIPVVRNNDQSGSGNDRVFLGYLFIDGNKGSYTGKGIHWNNPTTLSNPILTMHEVAVIDCEDNGIDIDVTTSSVVHLYKLWSLNHTGKALLLQSSDSVIFKLNVASNSGTEVELTESSSYNNFMGCYIGGAGGSEPDNGKVVLKGAIINYFGNNTIDYGGRNGVVLKDGSVKSADFNVFTGGSIDDLGRDASNTYDGISLEGSAADNVVCGMYIGKSPHYAARLKYAIDEGASCDYNLFVGLNVRNVLNATKINRQGANSKIRGCIGQADAG